MARPIRGDVRTLTINRKGANGVIYVYERTVKYNPKTRCNDILGSKLIGKRLTKDGPIVGTNFRMRPERPVYKRKHSDENRSNSESSDSTADVTATAPVDTYGTARWHMGMMSLLKWAGKASGIEDDLCRAMPPSVYGNLAERINALSQFWIATGGDTLPRLFSWQAKHGIAEEKMLSEDMCRAIFEQLGQHEECIQGYFKARANRLQSNDAIAYDSTTISTYSESQIQARYGFNKEHDGLPTIKLLTLYSLKDDQPVAYCTQPGNIPDVICVKNALKQLDFLEVDMPLLVKDNGFYSSANIVMCIKEHIKFQIRVTANNGKWIKECIDEHMSELNLLQNALPWEVETSALTVTVRPEFNTAWQYNTEKHRRGEKITIKPRLYLTIVRNEQKYHEEKSRFIADLVELKRRLEADEELPPAALSRAEKYLDCRHTRGGIKVTIKQDECEQVSRYFGIYALLSNKLKDRDENITTYRRREHIEDLYELFKQKADGRKPSVWDSDRLRGRQLVQFVALGYYGFLYRKINQLKGVLGQKNGELLHDTELNLSRERELLSWLNNVSLYDILQWFDAVEITRLVGRKHPASRIVSECTRRDLMFLEKIGYTGDILAA